MRGLGNKERREQLAERRIVLAPVLPHQRSHSCTSSDFVRVSAGTPALRISSPEYEMRHALRMLDHVGDGDRTALGNPEQRKLVEMSRIDDAFEVQQHRLEGQIAHLSIRETTAPLVVTNEPILRRSAFNPVPPDRTFRIELQVRHPSRRLHDRRPFAHDGVRNARAIVGGAKPYIYYR